MYVCMYVYISVLLCMYVCMQGHSLSGVSIVNTLCTLCMYVCIHLSHVCMNTCMYVCMNMVSPHTYIPESEDVSEQAADGQSLRELGSQSQKRLRIAGHGYQPMYVCMYDISLCMYDSSLCMYVCMYVGV